MGNSSTKESREDSRPDSIRNVSSPTSPSFPGSSSQQASGGRLTGQIYTSRSGRNSRHDLSFLHIGRGSDNNNTGEPARRETKQEKEARRAERDRIAREKERERSMQEEGVDGGYLVTLGTYTGPEDFSKAVVRQLQIERRLAPFWKGLNDHSDSWTEHQLVAAARGLPIPAPDEVPQDMARTGSQMSNPRSSDGNVNNLTVPISSRSQSYQSETSANLSASHPAFSNAAFGSPPTPTSTSSPLFRGRAKTLASLTTSSKDKSPDLTPQEIRLPKDPYVNGQPIEAYLYKDATECPICFLYYPPYLNKTRCCDQPICSECFVQIKRPDPHPREHEQPGEQRPPEEEAEQLVSEVAACPFCVAPEFGVTYEPPPFRRGLTFANQANTHTMRSAMSSSSSLASGVGQRRRAMSLSASDAAVITTDRVRPDWAKKLSDARAHALRRSAAATALHNAAYVLGNNGGELRGGFGLGRRRRTLFGDSPSASGSGTPRFPEGMNIANVGAMLDRVDRQGADGNGDLFPGRTTSRRNRVEDLEDLMMMEAIRLSLAAEEDRKRKEDKEMIKEEKKKAKEEKKEAKKAEKAAKKSGGKNMGLYQTGTNDSTSTWSTTTSMARSTSNLGTQSAIPESRFEGKGKAPASAYNEDNKANSSRDDSQRHLEAQRAHLQPTGSSPIPMPGQSHLRQISNASSASSSFVDSAPGSMRDASLLPSANASGLDVSAGAQDSRTETPLAGGAGSEPMFNFRSLTAMISEENKGRESEHIEDAAAPSESRAEEELKEPSPRGSPRMAPALAVEGNRSRGDSGESNASAPPPIYVERSPGPDGGGGDDITPAPHRVVANGGDQKHYGDFQVFDHGYAREAAQ